MMTNQATVSMPKSHVHLRVLDESKLPRMSAYMDRLEKVLIDTTLDMQKMGAYYELTDFGEISSGIYHVGDSTVAGSISRITPNKKDILNVYVHGRNNEEVSMIANTITLGFLAIAERPPRI